MMAAAFNMGATISATASPAGVYGYISPGAPSDVTTGATLAVGQGIAPYTYAWIQLGVTPYAWTIGSAAAANTAFTAHTLPQGVEDTATFQVTITDSAGSTGRATVTATAYNDTFVYRGPF